jgi:CRISPR-associated protein Csm4
VTLAGLWTSYGIERASVGRSGGSIPYTVDLVKFSPGCGLAVLAQVEDEWRDDIVACLRWLGDAGLGGRRSTGAGQFDLAVEAIEIAEPSEPNAHVTLSHYVPTARELEAGVLGEPARISIVDRSGWIGSIDGSGLRHKSVRMIAAGSVVARTAAGPPVGRVVDVTPDGFRDHEVLRAGWAFPIGVVAA